MGLFSTKPKEPTNAGCFVFFFFIALPLFIGLIVSFGGFWNIVYWCIENAKEIYVAICVIVGFFIIMINTDLDKKDKVRDKYDEKFDKKR